MDKDRKKTIWVLSFISLVMSIPIALWIVFTPQYFLSISGIDSYNQISFIYLFASLLIAFGYIYYTFKVIPFVQHMQKEFSLFKLVGVWAAFVSGFMEEIVFRHMLMNWAMSIGLGSFSQVVLSAIVFGGVHMSWGLLRGDFKTALPAALSTALLGLLLAVLYISCGRNVLPCILAHILINLVIEPWLILAAINGQWNQNKALIGLRS